ncbi:uncharacterized protein LOC121876257 [Homarus americanus]|uniref:Monomeric sarcosine oxidase-like n=1 Tax=Homarus americanus TaxID=6706 RepID=A0A8J5JLE0_HOMAM|nr:uncharacterized protein LOC121876257 [Homarus americanus]XP_042237216.1 uncharacterized protein LOC121876257 [Homarus americanus]XP_042237217.1 uncharacterized protein LOC121876257 [Homarus americanus]XP_042237218.1 uncharacterized protein LOC121876257 [Homarus americanus]XP_042237219.1 uncharacterized protein LOC121876257 [Homarus americanus]XP_042237220.1 uncharacterized protein LOC121876257 [Homarus americanus]XP_042237222.1 uncharacterized protein LOC121876257 [Homarus americanus]XP_0
MAGSVQMTFDLVVVGSGLMGSAAARHAASIPNTSVCLIGPAEPQTRASRQIFGCWYDEGRVYRRIAAEHTWSVLAQQSVARYTHLEHLSGVRFHEEVGYVHATPDAAEYQELMKCGRDQGLNTLDLTRSWRKHFPFFNFPQESYIFWEKSNAGHLSPRNLVRAQQVVARRCGAQVMPQVVSTVRPAHEPSHRWEVVTEGGEVVRAWRVLVAVGGSASLRPLFRHVAPGLQPHLQLRTQTVAYFRISDQEAHRLRYMPTLFTNCRFEDLDGGYALPPIKYPDGRWYLKVSHNRRHEEVLVTEDQVTKWYRRATGIPECVAKLTRFLHHLLPDVQFEEVSGDGCLTSHTPNQEPYIDIIAQGFGVALGGNRWAAKSSDEIGRLAARLVVLGEWESEVPRERVKIIWTTQSKL